ncbi:MAG: NUDIX hydrolase, partial [Thermodesulfobacteriota bacterium]
MLKPWELISTQADNSYRIFGLRTDWARSPRTDKIHEFYILESPCWVNIIPLTPEKQVIMIRQYRHGIRDFTLEIPGGLVEEDDTPQSAAARELREETGYCGEETCYVGCVHPNPAIQDNICYTYLARDVYKLEEQSLDEKEDIELVTYPLQQIPELIT